ncbi:hypothetical protein KKC97_05690 [bacterium]|nr:hypothetical protein [bacterium]MBU1637142.1 hypothetical protein [bacterium]
MNKKLLLLFLLSLTVWFGCDKDDDPPQRTWTANLLWSSGSRPIASPDGERVLFIEEGANGGLYLLENGQARKLNEGSPALRADYCWSHDGTRVCCSGPGLPGEASAGIYLSSNAELTDFERIWDRGSDPVFTRFDEEILCAGPEDGVSDGIWKIDLTTQEPIRIISKGVEPHLSPDGHKIAYTYTTGGVAGRTLVVFDRQSLESDTIGVGAAALTWLADSETIIYERVQNDSGDVGLSRLFLTEIDEFAPGELLFENAANPVGIPGTMRYLFNTFSGDLAEGIRIGEITGSYEQLADSGFAPYAVSEDHIVAAAASGIFEIVR